MQMFIRPLAILILATGLSLNAVAATTPEAGMNQAIRALQQAWAKATYQTPESGREAAFKALSEETHQLSRKFPGRAEPMIWEAIVLSGYARAEGGLAALAHVKQARDLLLAAEKLDAGALDGSVYTSLGSLYYKVPGWPLSFGDDGKARDYLAKALSMNPTGIDPNYFQGDFLLGQGDYTAAAEALQRALSAPPRPGRELADAGRRAEIRKDLQEVESRL